MTDLDTHLDGSAESLRSVGRWMRRSFGDASDGLAHAAYRARTAAGGAWAGSSSEAFADAAKHLGSSTDSLNTTVLAAEGGVEQIASALSRAQSELAAVRGAAASKGLTVSGSTVRNPGPRLEVSGLPPGPDASPQEHVQWAEATRAVERRAQLVDAFTAACVDADEALARLNAVLEEVAQNWQKWSTQLLNIGADFTSGVVGAAYVLGKSSNLTNGSAFWAGEASRLRGHLDAMVTPSGKVLDRAHFYDLLDDSIKARTTAGELRDASKSVKVPKGLGRALGILGVVATGYGIYVDIQQGEGHEQAVASNVGGMIAGIAASVAAGAVIGAQVGTFIPIPGVGTAVGLVAGAVIGTVVGAFTSGAIDSLYEHGMDGLDDVGTAIANGWQDVEDLGSAVGDLASGAWEGLFG